MAAATTAPPSSYSLIDWATMNPLAEMFMRWILSALTLVVDLVLVPMLEAAKVAESKASSFGTVALAYAESKATQLASVASSVAGTAFAYVEAKATGLFMIVYGPGLLVTFAQCLFGLLLIGLKVWSMLRKGGSANVNVENVVLPHK